ncbi:MAG: beta strand repeat-containing protein, partial [Planctomycetia bacterium]
AGGNNTFTGDVLVAGGTLRMGSATGLLASSTGAITTTGGVLDLNGNSITRSGVLTLAGGGVTSGTLNLTGPSITGSAGTVTATIIGTGTVGLLKSGTEVLVLSGSTTYPGNTTIGGGILQFGPTTALYGGTTANWVRTKITGSSGATLAVNVGGTGEFQPADVTTLLTGVLGTINNNGLMAGSNIGFDTTNSGTAFTLADVVANTLGTGSGSVGLVKLGSGTLVLSASNTFTGETQVGYGGGPNAGVLQLTGTGQVSQTVTIFGGTFDTAGLNRSLTTLTLGGGAAGSTASLQTGSGTATLAGNVTFTATNNPAGGTIGGNLSLNAATRTFTVNDSTAADADLTISAVINQGTAAAGLTKTGFGTLALTGQNTFTGKVSVNQGAVQIDSINNSGNNSPLGTSGTTDLGSAWRSGTLRWVGATSGTTNRTFNLSGTGGAAIEASGLGALVIESTVAATGGGVQTLTLGGSGTAANTIGAISNGSGTTSVVKDGPGLWRINAASAYTGSFTLRNGTLVAAVDSVGTTGAFGAGSVTDVFIGDSSPTASGTATLLMATDRATTKVMNVQAGSGSQVVMIGSQGTGGMADFQGNVYLGRPVTLVAGSGGTTSFSGFFYGPGGPGGDPLTMGVTIGSATNTGVVSVRGLATTGTVGVQFGTLRLAPQVQDALGRTTPVVIGAASAGATLDVNGRLQTLANLAFTGIGGSVADLAGGGGLALNGAGSPAAVGVTGTGHVI